MLRLFTGLQIPPDISERLHAMQEGLAGARWIEPGDFHITLRFIGEVDEALAGEISARLAAIRQPPFEVRFAGAGYFGGKRPRSLHLGIEHSQALDMLHYLNERAVQSAGGQADGRKFSPHVTLARLTRAKVSDVENWVSMHGLDKPPAFTATGFCLFSAKPHGGGGPYVAEESFSLLASS